MRRTFFASGVAGAVLALAWLEFEEPRAGLMRAVMLVAAAVVAVSVPRWPFRLAACVVAAGAAVRVVYGVWLPLHPVGAGRAVWASFDGGFSDFYSTHLPFDPPVHPAMAELVLLAAFAFTLAVGLLVAARRPVAAALVLLVGAGWPATLIVPAHGAAIGAAILGGALVVLAVAGSRRIPGFAIPFAAALVLGGAVAGTALASNHPVLNWQSWNISGATGGLVNVRFVWESQYRGVSWPKTPTTVLEIRSRTEPSYFRAAILDDFVDGRWIAGPPRAADSLEPVAALRPSNQTQQDVTIEGLVDTRLLGSAQPVRFSSDQLLVEPERGIAEIPTGYTTGFRYTVWSYAPSPTPEELGRSTNRYPKVLADQGMLDVGNSDAAEYAPLARLAHSVTFGAPTQYAAVADLERWFLSGAFRYSNHPRYIAPPLVSFVTTTRSGYCQHFAGAMALMLRYLGIPARVAVGFAGPTYHDGAWTFTDRDAHAWVEVWFKRYGWLTFDPTPASPGSSRARLIAQYTSTLGGGGGGKTNGGGSGPRSSGATGGKTNQLENGDPRSAGHKHPGQGGGGVGSSFPFLLVLALLVAAVVAGIALAKEARRRLLRRGDDPRRIAAACREELASFLLDQGIESPPSATVRELGLLAQRLLGADAAEFVTATTAARYGRPEVAADAAQRARRESRPLLAACRRSLTLRDRLRGFFSVRSLARIGSASLERTAP